MILAGESCEYEWDGNSPTITCCSNPNHVIVSPGECGCENGSSEPDCSLDDGGGDDAGGDDDPPPPPPCDPAFENCNGGGGTPPGDGGDGDGCDPNEITCDPEPVQCPTYQYGFDQCKEASSEDLTAIRDDVEAWFEHSYECQWAKERIIWATYNANTVVADEGMASAWSDFVVQTQTPLNIIIRDFLFWDAHRGVGNLAHALAHEAGHWWYQHVDKSTGNEQEAEAFADSCVDRG